VNCPKCQNVLVESNIVIDHYTGDYYNRYYCFGCDSLFEIVSVSGDFVEENLIELGEVECI
jgi:hypothetical protein